MTCFLGELCGKLSSMSKTQKTAEPCVMVIFGATGDLTKRKLFPAIYNLAKEGHIPDNFAIIGVGRQEMESEDFCRQMQENLAEFLPGKSDDDLMLWFRERTYYTGGDFDDDKKLFKDIKEMAAEVRTQHDIPDNFFFYMAIPPSLFANVTQKIVKNGLGKEENGTWRRFIFEQPFGHDLESQKAERRSAETVKSGRYTV